MRKGHCAGAAHAPRLTSASCPSDAKRWGEQFSTFALCGCGLLRADLAKEAVERIERFETALVSVVGRVKKTYVSVNLEKIMAKTGLDHYYPPEVGIAMASCW